VNVSGAERNGSERSWNKIQNKRNEGLGTRYRISGMREGLTEWSGVRAYP